MRWAYMREKTDLQLQRYYSKIQKINQAGRFAIKSYTYADVRILNVIRCLDLVNFLIEKIHGSTLHLSTHIQWSGPFTETADLYL